MSANSVDFQATYQVALTTEVEIPEGQELIVGGCRKKKIEVLNGRVEQLEGRFTKEAKDNVDLCRIINDRVSSLPWMVANYPSRCGELFNPEEAKSKIGQYSYRFECMQDSRRDLSGWISRIKEEKYEGKQKYIGTCAEMCIYGFECPEIGNTRVEMYTITKGSHVFLVVGRDPTTDPTDPETWNPEAMICDPWANAYYPAKEYLRLYNWVSRVEIIQDVATRKCFLGPGVAPFDPTFQKLGPVMWNDPEIAKKLFIDPEYRGILFHPPKIEEEEWGSTLDLEPSPPSEEPKLSVDEIAQRQWDLLKKELGLL